MSYVRIWLHCVWGTKNHHPFLNLDKKTEVIDHIRYNAKTKDIYIDTINGYTDHIHCLLTLNADQSIAKVIQLIKGESSYWINKNKVIQSGFEWADEYFTVSVSESQVKKVRNYILNQELHHRNKTWMEEYDEFISKYKFERMKGRDEVSNETDEVAIKQNRN